MKPRPLLFLLASLGALSARAEIVERVIAKVNGDIITLSEFEARQVAAVQTARVPPEGVETFLRENNQRLLQEAIDDVLILQRARDLGVRVRPEYLDEIIEGIKKDNRIASEEQFQQQLRAEGLSLDELKRSIERNLLRRQVLSRDLEQKAAVSDAEALALYEANKERFTRPAGVRLAEIVVEGDGAQERAAALLERVRGGEDFAAVARENSASGTAQSGGDLGFVANNDLSPDLARVVAGLEPGGVSQPMATARGYRLVRLSERSPAAVTPFDQAKREIAEELVRDRMAKAYDTYVANLRQNAGAIDIRVREVPLQVTLPAGMGLGSDAARKDGTPEPEVTTQAPSGASDEEFATTPQARPERVAPPPAAGQEQPKEDTPPSPPPGA